MIDFAYDTKPFSTENAMLPDEFLEKLATHVHDAWVTRKLQEGWIYGDVKDESKKTTPCLVPYDELPESEKNYDRCTVLATINGLMLLNYRIVPKDGTGI